MLQARLELSERWACRVTGQHRSTQRRLPARGRGDDALRTELHAFSRGHPRWGSQGSCGGSPDARRTWWSATSGRPPPTGSGWLTAPTCAPRRASSTSPFIIDVYSRYIVGWQASRSLHTDLALGALEQAPWSRQGPFGGLVHHSDRGVQYLSIRYTERLADVRAVSSVGSRGDSYDNALAESAGTQ